ncbi:hypothetical protein GGX14DRAFT_568626 [Mycena pura]|uniref:Uncharacterized protein n=1 Tax=Mycena pura TaxID=153505 RepID=A0AAD6VCF3_9AGAR|nr:hypothetical protein GGX14DRAFT_568626 [Mycena pura]
MPARRDPAAPVFDPQRPRDLPKYFSDLAFLFTRSHITADADQKYHATRFLSLDDQELWEALPEFTDPAATFAEFTAAIFRLYPEADPDRRYSLTDLDTLVMEFSRTVLPSRAAFLEFYRRFLVVTSFLISKNRLTAFEQSRALVHAIPPNIWSSVHARLCICCPDVHLDDTYPLEAVRDAINFVFISSSTRPTSMSPSFLSTPVSSPIPVPAPCDPSLAALAEAVEKLAHLVSSSRSSSAASRLDLPPSPHRPVSRSSPSSLRPMSCSYCSDPAHFIAGCPLVIKDIAAGLCKRNTEGKVVLPNGVFIPHRVVGPNLRTRIVSWRSVNVPVPSASVSSSPADSRSCPAAAAPSLQSTASRQPPPVSTAHHAPIPQPSDAVPSRAALPSVPNSVHVPPPTRPEPALTLSEHERIATLECQIAALRARRRDVRTAATPAPETRTTTVFLSQAVSPSPDSLQPPAPCSIDLQHYLDPPHRQPSPATSRIDVYTPLRASQVISAPLVSCHIPAPPSGPAPSNTSSASSPEPIQIVETFSNRSVLVLRPRAPSATPRPTPHPPYRVSDPQAAPTPSFTQSRNHKSCSGESAITSASTPSVSRSYAAVACPRAVSQAFLRSIDPSPAPTSPVAASRVPDSPGRAPCTEPPVSSFPEPYIASQSCRPAPLPSQPVPEDLAVDFEFPVDPVPTLRRSRLISGRRSTPVHVAALA